MIIRNHFLRECIYNSEQKLLVCVRAGAGYSARKREVREQGRLRKATDPGQT